jgi:RHS repeat-associated protein
VFQQSFDLLGAPLTSPTPELTRAGYTGHEHDRDLGLIDMRGRIYDTLSSQFISRDPVTQAPFWSQGLNGYAYVFNDPINNVDPTGFAADGAAAGGGGLIVGLLFGSFAVHGVVVSPLRLGYTAVRAASGGYDPGTYQMDARPGNGSAFQRPIGPLDSGIPNDLSGSEERLACGGDVCIEILRQQQEARLKTILRNIEMVSELEWELFWAYTGGQVVKAGVRGFQMWRAARAAETAARIPFKGFQEWGRPLWGRNLEGAQKALENMTPEVARTIDPGKARQALKFYKQAAASGRGGETATARVKLMERILQLQ